MNSSAKTGFRIGSWDVDPQQNLLRSPERKKTLEPKVMDVLVFLAERQGEVVSRQEILDAVWSEVVVGDEVVSRAVSLLRTELGDDQTNPRYLKTISKRGYSLIAEVIPAPSIEPIPRRPSRKLSFAIIAVLALVIAWFAVVEEPTHPDGDQSVAVLPFVDMSPNGDQEYFGDGMAVELINELLRLDGLRVSPSTSSFSFKGTDESPGSIAEKLDVATIVEGSIRKDGDRIRITAQLIDIADEKILWADTYDRELENIFAVQEEIATEVSGALGVRLGVGGVNDYRGAGTRNIEAHDAFLEALSNRSAEAIPHLNRAIELDPNYAAAWSMLSLHTLIVKGWFAYPGENRENEERALEFARRAVELDPSSAQSLSQLGLMLEIQENWIGAEEAHAKAISLLSSRPTHCQYGNFLGRAGHFADALEQFERSEAAEPLAGRRLNRVHVAITQGQFAVARDEWVLRPDWPLHKGVDLSIALNEGDAEKIKAIMAARDPMEIATIELYAPVLEVFDSRERVLSTLRAVYADNGSRWPSKLTDIALLAAYYGDDELALQTMREEARLGSPRFGAAWYPLMADVRQSQGFKELVVEYNLVAYWREKGWPELCRPLGDEDFECW